MSKKKIKIEISEEEINKRIDQVEQLDCDSELQEFLINTLKALVELDRLVGLKSATIARLRKVFGKQAEAQNKKKAEDKRPAVGNTGGHGRNGQDHYSGATIVNHEIIDDTQAKLLSLVQENELNKGNKKARTGMHTTGVLSKIEEKQIVLYFTGRKYSGENLKELLTHRTSNEPVAVMSDALTQNNIDSKDYLKYLCLVHGRRKFIDLEEKFKEESEYILKLIGQVYKNEEHCKSQGIKKQERLEYHKVHSEPVLNKLKKWLDLAFKEKKVEPNSS